MRPGLGWDGVQHLQSFVQKGGVLLTATDTSRFALSIGLADGVSVGNAQKMKIVGSVVGTRLVDGASPIAYGYDEKLAAYGDNGPIFSLTSISGGRGFRRLGAQCARVPQGGARWTIRILPSDGPASRLPRNPNPKSGKLRR
jgi:hypothetical protein